MTQQTDLTPSVIEQLDKLAETNPAFSMPGLPVSANQIELGSILDSLNSTPLSGSDIANTNTIILSIVLSKLNADIRYQSTSSVVLADDVSGLKATLIYAGSGGLFGTAATPARSDHTHNFLIIPGFENACIDAVGNSLVDSSTIDFTYNNLTHTITADLIAAGVSITHTEVSDFDAAVTNLISVTPTNSLLLTYTGGDITGDLAIQNTATITLAIDGSGLKATLADTTVTPASYGSAGTVATFTVDAKGRLTAAANATISITASRVSDFNNAVDARAAALIAAGAGISLTYIPNTSLTIASTITQYTDEKAMDAVAAMIKEGNGIGIVYNDGLDTLTFTNNIAAGTGIGLAYDAPSNTYTISTSITQYTDLKAKDAVGGILTDTNSIDFTYTTPTKIEAALRLDGSTLAVGVGGVKVNPTLTLTSLTLPSMTGNNITTDLETSIKNLDDQDFYQNNSGVVSWGAGTTYYTILTSPLRIQIDRGGTGYLKGKKVTWAGGQTASIASNNTCYMAYINSSGILATIDISTITDWSNYIFLFQVLHTTGNTVYVSKEDHPYEFSSKVSQYLHNNVGINIQSTGANATRVATGTGGANADREIKIVGQDTLNDHGLSTAIPDSAGAGVSWTFFYISAGVWVQDVTQTQMLMQYNNSGTLTALLTGGANNSTVMTLYVCKDDKNTSAPRYIAVVDNSRYSSLTAATTAINNGTTQRATNELLGLEPCQLGYAIVHNNVSGGYIESIIISKYTFNSKLVGGGVSGDHLLLNNINGGTAADGGHTNLINKHIVASASPTVNSDTLNGYKTGNLWYRADLDRLYTCIDATTGAAVWHEIAINTCSTAQVTLVDNTVTTWLSIDNADGTKIGVWVDYVCYRGTDMDMGTIFLGTLGSGTAVITKIIDTQAATLGITFAGSRNDTTDKIELDATLSSTGADAKIQFRYRKQLL